MPNNIGMVSLISVGPIGPAVNEAGEEDLRIYTNSLLHYFIPSMALICAGISV